MTYTDPSLPPVQRQPERVVEVRRESSPLGWLVAGVVAIVAVIAVAFMLTSRPMDASTDQIAQAQEQGRAAGLIEGAQVGLQTGAQQAQAAAESSARDAAAAADAVRRQTEAQAQNAADAAQNAAANAPPANGATTDGTAPSPNPDRLQ